MNKMSEQTQQEILALRTLGWTEDELAGYAAWITAEENGTPNGPGWWAGHIAARTADRS